MREVPGGEDGRLATNGKALRSSEGLTFLLYRAVVPAGSMPGSSKLGPPLARLPQLPLGEVQVA